MGGRARTQKMSVTLPAELVAEIRAVASPGEMSSLFAEALEHYLAFRKQRIALQRGFGAWSDQNHPELATAEDSMAYVRAIREADAGRLSRLEGTGAE